MSNLIFPDLPGRINQTRTLFYSTSVQTADSGAEYRIARYGRPRYRYTINHNFSRTGAAYLEAQAIASHLVRHGAQRESFLLRDHLDYTVTAHGFGVGNGASTKFPLQRTEAGRWTDLLGTWDTYTTPRTNYVLRSQSFDHADWTKRATHSVSAADVRIAPDGTLTAETVTATAGTGNEGLYQDLAAAGNGTYTVSVWLRAGTLTAAKLCVKDRATDTVRGSVDITMGSAWTRYSVSGTTAGGTTGLRIEVNGVGSGTFGVWGAQAETGSAATPYIPTTSAAVREDPPFWTANQSTGALVAPATFGTFDPVTEPVWSGVTLYKAGVAQTPSTDFTFSAGLVTFGSAPAAGAALTWTGSYYRRVRFDDDELSFERIVSDVLEGPGVELVSVIA